MYKNNRNIETIQKEPISLGVAQSYLPKISLIISSHNESYYQRFIKSVEDSIGCSYELIKIENPGKYSLSEAYNTGSRKAKGEYICFVHEDVIFLSNEWDVECINVFEKEENVGLIGVAGCAYKSTIPSHLWTDYSFKFGRGRIYQGYKSYTNGRKLELDPRESKTLLSDVVCVDGVFMFTTKDIAIQCPFDEHLFTGFHCYDLDFSTQIYLSGRRVVVDRDIYLFHASNGVYDEFFFDYAKAFSKKYICKLPLCAEKIPKTTFIYIEFNVWFDYIKRKSCNLIKKIGKFFARFIYNKKIM